MAANFSGESDDCTCAMPNVCGIPQHTEGCPAYAEQEKRRDDDLEEAYLADCEAERAGTTMTEEQEREAEYAEECEEAFFNRRDGEEI